MADQESDQLKIPNEIIDAHMNYFNNMNEYWHELGKKLKVSNNTIKECDLKVFKGMMVERMIPEYVSTNHDNIIKKITDMIYFTKLKKNATKGFLKWVNKQLSEDNENSAVN